MIDNNHLSLRINNFLGDQFDQLGAYQTGNLLPAMKYSLLNGGKRMRPLLVYATAESVGVDTDVADHIAAAIEMIHAYSLIHDDLPAMDDDDLRRGQATCHIAYDEATAILAADALQALSFEVLTHTPTSSHVVIQLIQQLSHAAGVIGMVGGQMLDLEGEGKQLTLEALQIVHAKKTGALLEACVSMVIECNQNLTKQVKNTYLQFAKNFGMAYQIIDDILDVTTDTEILGKPAQSDIKNNKSTYPSILGLNSARNKAKEHVDTAFELLDQLPNSESLFQLTEIIANRSY